MALDPIDRETWSFLKIDRKVLKIVTGDNAFALNRQVTFDYLKTDRKVLKIATGDIAISQNRQATFGIIKGPTYDLDIVNVLPLRYTASCSSMKVSRKCRQGAR